MFSLAVLSPDIWTGFLQEPLSDTAPRLVKRKISNLGGHSGQMEEPHERKIATKEILRVT